ncbi:chromosome partition protein Smc [Rhodobiaceae bacterium]|nr:chromosome partition protein Smc [Rhodobiaceae bacterium]
MKDLKFKITAEGFDKASKPFKNIIKTSGTMQKTLGKTAKELKSLNDTQKRMTGFASLKRQSQATSLELAKAQKEAQRLTRAYKTTANRTNKMARAAQTAAKRVKELKLKQTAHRTELQASRSALTRAGINVKKLGQEQVRTAQKIASTNRRLDQQQRALRRATENQNKLRRASERYRKTLQTQSGAAFVGAAGMASGGMALRGLASTVTPGISFDEQMSAVGAISRVDKSSKAFADLRAQALELGSTTQFSASEAAAGMEFLAMAGFDATEVIASMPGVLDLAKAGRTDLAETANIASNILSTFDLDASRMGEVGDALTATFTRSNVDLGQLGETMKYVGPVANELGASFQEASAMAGLLGNSGIQASDAGTALRSIYSRFAAGPAAAAKAFDKLGIKTDDAAGNMRAIPDLLAEVALKTENLGSSERLGFFNDIAGLRAGGALAKLVGNSGAGAVMQFIEVLNNAHGEAARVAREMADNTAGDLKGLASAWEGLNIALSDTQTGGLRSIVQGITSVTRGITTWVRENPRLAGTLFTIVGAVAALWTVVGGLALAVAGIVGPFAIAKFALTTVGLKAALLGPLLMKVASAVLFLGNTLLFTPIGWFIGGIALIAGAAYLIYRNWEPISEFFSAKWAEVKATFAGGIGSITAAIINWSPMGLFYRSFATVLNWFGAELPETFTGFGAALVDGLIDGIVGAWSDLTETISNIGDLITGTFSSVMGIRSPSRVFARLGGFVSEGLADGITGSGQKAVNAVSRLGGSLPRTLATGAVAATVAAVPAYAGAAPQNSVSQSNVEIHIHAAPGMDAHEIARQVRAELDARDREREARNRSSLFDQR